MDFKSSAISRYIRNVYAIRNTNIFHCKLWHKQCSKDQNSRTINRKFIATKLHTAAFFPRTSYCSVWLKNRLHEKETEFIQPASKCDVWIDKEREKYFRDFLLTQMNLQLWQATFSVRFSAYENAHGMIIRESIHLNEKFGHITERVISVGIIDLSNKLGAQWRLWICVVSFNDRSELNYVRDDVYVNNLRTTIAIRTHIHASSFSLDVSYIIPRCFSLLLAKCRV